METVMLLAPTPGVGELAKWLLLEVSVRGLWSRPAYRLILELPQATSMTLAVL